MRDHDSKNQSSNVVYKDDQFTNTEKHCTEEKMTAKQKLQQQRMQRVVDDISSGIRYRSSTEDILRIILPFIRIFLEENLFRYLLGLLNVYTNLTAEMIANCAGCLSSTVRSGRKDVESGKLPDVRRQRRRNAGRKTFEYRNPRLISEILKYVRLRSYGPCTKDIAEYTAVTLTGIQSFIKKKFSIFIAESTIYRILITHDIRLRTNKKLLYANSGTETESQRVTRHLQFDYIDEILQKADDPKCIILSVDCKKKENLGSFHSGGRCYAFKNDEVKTEDHTFFKPLKTNTLEHLDDLLDRQEGKAIPYGVMDYTMNKAYISVGITHDTPEFVAKSIERFFDRIRKDHPDAEDVYILCDGGGSNNARSLVFKYYMTMLSQKIGMKITIVHYPPYRSKFNKIERHVFAQISKKFERSVLYNLRTVLALIQSTTTSKGLTVEAELDTEIYHIGQKLTPDQQALIRVKYIGPTKDADTKLSYLIDGTKLEDSSFPSISHKTVFDTKEDIDQSCNTTTGKEQTKKSPIQSKKKKSSKNKSQTSGKRIPGKPKPSLKTA